MVGFHLNFLAFSERAQGMTNRDERAFFQENQVLFLTHFQKRAHPLCPRGVKRHLFPKGKRANLTFVLYYYLVEIKVYLFL